ncbi:MAG: hypothetical protein JXB39_01840, partial [Deltaproteobacteria bacterium]|nr:hypothetical protein [Deltaproteobacteria bacterium]
DTDADTDADSDADTDADVDVNVEGEIVHNDCGVDPPTVGIWSILPKAKACGDAWDTGGASWRDAHETDLPVTEHTFEGEVPVGSWAATALASHCYGCTGFKVDDESAAWVEIWMYDYTSVDAPYLYLYPEVPESMHVELFDPGVVTASDPPYPEEGWDLLALPDGTLLTEHGPRPFLFYELAVETERFQYDEGWCVPGRLAQATIEEAMEDLGFLPREIDDFAAFWDPQFPGAEWMTIYPQTRGLYRLPIRPRPDHLLRGIFVLEAGCRPVAPPDLEPVPREGTHAAEWGLLLLDGLDRPEIAVTAL